MQSLAHVSFSLPGSHNQRFLMSGRVWRAQHSAKVVAVLFCVGRSILEGSTSNSVTGTL